MSFQMWAGRILRASLLSFGSDCARHAALRSSAVNAPASGERQRARFLAAHRGILNLARREPELAGKRARFGVRGEGGSSVKMAFPQAFPDAIIRDRDLEVRRMRCHLKAQVASRTDCPEGTELKRRSWSPRAATSAGTHVCHRRAANRNSGCISAADCSTASRPSNQSASSNGICPPVSLSASADQKRQFEFMANGFRQQLLPGTVQVRRSGRRSVRAGTSPVRDATR